jgi:hypothetical protein
MCNAIFFGRKISHIQKYVVEFQEIDMLLISNSNFSSYHKAVYFAGGIKLCNVLPPNIKILKHGRQVFKTALKVLLAHSLYSVEGHTSADSLKRPTHLQRYSLTMLHHSAIC